nr:hypothetical protein [Tanacetum cinerariifolium]
GSGGGVGYVVVVPAVVRQWSGVGGDVVVDGSRGRRLWCYRWWRWLGWKGQWGLWWGGGCGYGNRGGDGAGCGKVTGSGGCGDSGGAWRGGS